MEKFFYSEIYNNEKKHWWYSTRRKIVHKLIGKYLPQKDGLKILDVGCGGGLLTQELQKYGKAVCIDPSEEAVNFACARGVNAEKVSIIDYKRENEYDCVVALDVLEHCENDLSAVKNIYNLLKPGGIAIIFVPALNCFWGEQDVISHHFRRYTRNDLHNKFKNAGFEPITQSYFNFFLSPAVFLSRKLSNIIKIKTISKSELTNSNFILNKIGKIIFGLEYYLIPKFKFPFGVSLLGVYKK